MNNYSILVVDDEELLRESLTRNLKKAGYEVTMVESGTKAIEILKDNDYDLIITDLMMEGIDGLDLLKNIKEKNIEAMVIIITGYGTMNTAIDALQLGAADYMLKPYNRKELLLRISRCFEKLELKRKVKLFEDILPVCCKCRRVRDDTGVEHGQGEWMNMESYLKKRSNVDLSHGFCRECFEEEQKILASVCNP